MDELTNKTGLKRPMSREAMGNDSATLRNLVGMLNDPRLTGAVIPEEEKEKAPKKPVPEQAIEAAVAAKAALQQPHPATLPAPLPAAPPSPAIIPTPAPTPSPLPVPQVTSRLLFFTGNAKVGKSWLAAQIGATILEFDDPILAMAINSFGTLPAERGPLLNHFFTEVRTWGEGTISANFSLTATRAMFIQSIRESGKMGDKLFQVPVAQFGTPGFWLRSLIARAKQVEGRVIVTDVHAPEQYTGLMKAGFAVYHVTCNNLTRSSRGGSALTSAVADSIDRDVTKKISESPSGKKLRCVWNDDKYPAPSPRLMTVAEFLESITG